MLTRSIHARSMVGRPLRGRALRVGVLGAALLGLGLGLVTAACGDEKDAAPVVAAKAFVEVMHSGDAKELIGLLDRAAAERLEGAASRAGDQVGGRRNVAPYEMIQIVDVPHTFQVTSAELVSGDDAQAQVALISADGTREVLDMVFQEGAWRVRVPLPPEHGGAR
jgi:hypothetical protein